MAWLRLVVVAGRADADEANEDAGREDADEEDEDAGREDVDEEEDNADAGKEDADEENDVEDNGREEADEEEDNAAEDGGDELRLNETTSPVVHEQSFSSSAP